MDTTFLIDGYYKHSGGSKLHVIGNCTHSYFFSNPSLVAEDAEGSIYLVGTDETAYTGFEMISRKEFVETAEEAGDANDGNIQIDELMVGLKGRPLFGERRIQ